MQQPNLNVYVTTVMYTYWISLLAGSVLFL